jgi:DNA-binding MarR family transcriptional regulator
MSKAKKAAARDRSPLYRLIAAGQLAHRAVLAPALQRGLEPGDDALLHLLATSASVTAADLAAATGLAPTQLRKRLGALIDRELVVLRASSPHTLPQLMLTARGARLEALLADQWLELEQTLFAELKPRQRKTLGKRLKAILVKLET